MGAGIYTERKPYATGWWWMKDEDGEKPVEIVAGPDSKLVVNLPGRTVPWSFLTSKEMDACFWSMFPIAKPYKWATSRVRVILGEYTMEVEIRDEELLEAKFPGEILERNLAQMMVKIFQERIVPNRAAFQDLQKEHADLKNFIAERRPDYMIDFRTRTKGS